MMRLLRALPVALEGYTSRRLGQHGAAIAYRTLVSIAPLAIVMVAVAGLLLRDDDLRNELVDRIVDALPFEESSRQEVENAIVAIASPASLLGLLGLLAFAWTATGLMGAIRIGLEAAFAVPRGRPAVRSKLVDAILVAGTAGLVVVLAATSAVGDLVRRGVEALAGRAGVTLPGVGWEIGSRVLQVAVVVGIVLLLYRYVPARTVATRHALVGAGVTGLMLVAISLASKFVLDGASELSVVYGSLTAVFAFLFAIYLAGCALLLGAALAWALGQPPGPPGPPLREQLREGVLGLFRSPPEARLPAPASRPDDDLRPARTP